MLGFEDEGDKEARISGGKNRPAEVPEVTE